MLDTLLVLLAHLISVTLRLLHITIRIGDCHFYQSNILTQYVYFHDWSAQSPPDLNPVQPMQDVLRTLTASQT